MSEELPTLIDPQYLALQGSRLQGKISLARLVRLHDSLSKIGQNDAVYIDWLFANDAQNRPTINGYTQIQLPLVCQRCLQTMLLPLKTEIALLFLTNNVKENDLPNDYEVFTLASVPISLITLVEDELILALPIVTVHEKCSLNEHLLPNDFALNYTVQKNNPFHVLEKLKTK